MADDVVKDWSGDDSEGFDWTTDATLGSDWGGTDTPPPPPPPVPGVGVGVILDRPDELPPVSHCIVGPNGRADYPEVVGSWFAEEVNGYDNMSGIVEAARVIEQPDIYTDGAQWIVTDDDTGDIVAAGDLLDPAISGLGENGTAMLKAEGWGRRALRTSEPLSYQVRGYANLWVPRNSEPLGPDGTGYYVQGESRFQLSSDGSLSVHVDKTAVFADGDTMGWMLWRPGLRPGWQWAAGHIHVTYTGPNFLLRIIKTTGPDGSLVIVDDVAMPSGGDLGVDFAVTIDDPEDLINVEIHRVGAGSPTDDLDITITQLRVNGIAPPGDFFSGSDVARDIAGRMGFDASLVQQTSLNVLPLEVVDGTYADALDVAALISGAYWRGIGVPKWRAALEWALWDSEVFEILDPEFPVDLVPSPRYDEVLVPYLMGNGVATGTLRVTASTRLPIPRTYGPISLATPLPNEDNARAIGEQILSEVGKPHFSGTVKFTRAMDSRGRIVSGHPVKAQSSLLLPYNDGVVVRTKGMHREGGFVEATLDGGLAVVDRIVARRNRRMAISAPQ